MKTVYTNIHLVCRKIYNSLGCQTPDLEGWPPAVYRTPVFAGDYLVQACFSSKELQY